MQNFKSPNGLNASKHDLPDDGDEAFTQNVVRSMGPNTDTRLREVLTSLIKHVHSFAREINLTVDEWMAGVQMINDAGRMSNDRRDEGVLLCDTIGLESLVDDITQKLASQATDMRTESAILGPFFRNNAPLRMMGDTISFDTPENADVAYMHGQVFDAATKKTLGNVTLDVWQASTNGLYEQQDKNQQEFNLRGRFVTSESGQYSWYCIRPTPYPVPNDGPAGRLLELMDRHPYRPAHIHIMLMRPPQARRDGYKPLTTQIFDSASDYLEDDSVFAVKDSLLIDFVPRSGDPQAKLEVQYDIHLVSRS